MTEASLFDLIIHSPESERPAILDRETAGQPELRQRVERLVAAHDRRMLGNETRSLAEPHLSQTNSDEPAGSTRRNDDHLAGTVIAGKYKLIERIGEGGMGDVWLAQQTEPVKRQVAVKLIKAGMDSKQVLARFEAERQALAMMDHPNIAKVLDGGLHENRPYFVMELVKGVPITEYCDHHKLTPKQRLELFVPVCQAIQHAHQKGVIHRDIKPSNVLIAMYDYRPVPKVIDFGVAKATGATLTEHTLNTGFGGLVGTPQYMSPEQATFNNLDIDTRSDVYSLGVLLYELLTGAPPFAKKELEKKGLLEILRVVREEEPPKPSTKLSTADALVSLSANRGTEPKKLTGILRNELDWIVMKSLEKDRTRRYETANVFAADVSRYLSGEPVVAHPPSLGYRLRKYGQKNRVAIVTIFLFAVTLKTTTLISIWLASRAAIAENIAIQERDDAVMARQRESDERKKADAAKVEAHAKAAEANAVVKFLEDNVFAAARPNGQDGGLGVSVSLRAAVAASLPVLEKGFTEQPLVEARLRMALGVTFSYLAEHEQARDQFERARLLFSRHHGPDHPNTLASMGNLAIIYTTLNRHAEAIKLEEELLSIQIRVLPKDHPNTLTCMGNLATSYAAIKRYEEALKLREEVLAIQQKVLPPNHPHTLRSMSNLASSYADLNRQKEALKLEEEVLTIQKRELPPDHPDTLRSMANLSKSYSELNRHTEALKLREQVLAVRRRVLPKDHPDTLQSIWNVAYSLIQLGRGVEAIPLIDEFLMQATTNSAVDSMTISKVFSLRMQHFEKVGDLAGCRATAEMCEKWHHKDAIGLYDAACFRAVTAGIQAKAPGTDAARLAKDEADQAIQWLQKAVHAGWKDVAHTMKDADLDPIRERKDFKKLIAELKKAETK